MSVYYEDDTLRLLHGDALAEAKTLDAGSAQTIVTSPPYFGQRDYDVDGQYGAELDVEDFVEHLVDLFTELHRVLAADGTLWLNLGDSWASRWGSQRDRSALHLPDNERKRRQLPKGFKDKMLLGTPWRVALALQDRAGYILRSDNIWNKPNAMPEGVTDRPSKSHEYLFMFAKQRRYYYDAAAVANENGTSKRSVWNVPTVPFAEAHFAVYPPELIRPCILASSRPGDTVLDPFSGSGTTGMVATQEGRKYVGIELNASSLDLSLRTRFAQPVLATGAAS